MQLPEPCDSSQSGARIFRRMASQDEAPTTSCYPTPSKPMNIPTHQRNRLAVHFNTAPANSSLHENMTMSRPVPIQRPTIYSKPVQVTNAQENLQRIYGMERQPFQEYPERILEEAIQRINMLYKYSNYLMDSDKENTRRAYTPGRPLMIDGIYEGPSGYDDLVNEETDTESIGSNSDCQSNCCCGAEYNEMDYESLTPTEFRSVGDIIGYAKVVRAQRQEALGQLNSVMNQFSDAWTNMRKQLEARRAATAEQNQA